MKPLALLLLVALTLSSCADVANVPLSWQGHHQHPTSDLSDIDQRQPEYF